MMVKKNKGKKKIKGFSLQIIPFSEIQNLSINDRVKKILKIILGNKVIILQGKLRVEEEIRLIEDTMAMVDHVKNFKGIELSVIEPNMNNSSFMQKFKRNIAKSLIGHTNSLTIIGPAAIVKDIKRDPSKLEVLLG